MEEKDKLLGLMRFWLFGTFLIIVAAATIYAGGPLGTGLLIFKETNYWFAIGVAAVLCVGWYYLYKWYIGRKM